MTMHRSAGVAALRHSQLMVRGLSTATRGAFPAAQLLPVQPLTVYGRTSSSNTQKVLFALELSGAPYELVPASARIGPSQRFLTTGTDEGEQPYGVVGTEEYGALNPHQAIPTLITETGDSIWESHTIVRYLAAMYGLASGEGGNRCSGDVSDASLALERAQASMWMDWILSGADYGPAFGTANHWMIDEVARTPAAERDPKMVTFAHDMYVDRLTKVETHLGQAHSRYLCGDALSVADVAMGVELNRWSLCVHSAAASGLKLQRPTFPCLKTYYCELMALKPFVSTVFNNEREHHGLAHETGLLTLAALGCRSGCIARTK